MSLRMIYGCDELLVDWAKKMMGQNNFGPDPVAIGCGDGKELLCAVIYHNFREFDIFLSIAATSPRWAVRGVIGRFLHYPYEQLGCERTTVVCAKSNKRSRKLVEGIGWVREGGLRKGWDGTENAIVYGMLKSEAQKWIDCAPTMTNVIALNKEEALDERRKRRIGASGT